MRADAVRNRQRILEAAEDVFARVGLAVPVDVVAEAAGVGVGTLYRHFPTKEALFEAIVVSRLESFVEAAADATASDAPARAFFDFLHEFARQASLKRDLFDALLVAGIDIKSQCADLVGELERGIGRLLERAENAGAVRSDVTVKDVIGLVMGTCNAAAQANLDEAACDRMIDVVCDGLRVAR